MGSRASGRSGEGGADAEEAAEGEEAPEASVVDPALVEPEGENLLKPAREALEKALHQALAAQHFTAAGEAACALCVCVGESDRARAAELLNIYQSCKVQAELKNVLLAGQCPAHSPFCNPSALLGHALRSILPPAAVLPSCLCAPRLLCPPPRSCAPFPVLYSVGVTLASGGKSRPPVGWADRD